MLSLKNLARKGLKRLHACVLVKHVLSDMSESTWLWRNVLSRSFVVQSSSLCKKKFSMLIYLYISIHFYSITASPPVRCCGTARLWRVPVPASEHHGPRPHAGPTRVPGGWRVCWQTGATCQDYCTDNTGTWVRHLYLETESHIMQSIFSKILSFLWLFRSITSWLSDNVIPRFYCICSFSKEWFYRNWWTIIIEFRVKILWMYLTIERIDRFITAPQHLFSQSGVWPPCPWLHHLLYRWLHGGQPALWGLLVTASRSGDGAARLTPRGGATAGVRGGCGGGCALGCGKGRCWENMEEPVYKDHLWCGLKWEVVSHEG